MVVVLGRRIGDLLALKRPGQVVLVVLARVGGELRGVDADEGETRATKAAMEIPQRRDYAGTGPAGETQKLSKTTRPRSWSSHKGSMA